MDEYADRSSESERDELSDIEQEHSIDHVASTAMTSKPSESFAMPRELQPVKTPLMGIPATRTPLFERTLSKDQTLLEISTMRVPEGSSISSHPTRNQPTTSGSNPSLSTPSRAGTSAGVIGWGQGLIGDLAGQAVALNAFRRHSSMGEIKGKAKSESDDGVSNEHHEDELRGQGPPRDEDEEDDYWGGTVRRPVETKQKRNRQQVGRVLGRANLFEDNFNDGVRRAKLRSIQKHHRSKSRTLMRRYTNNALESPSSTISLDSNPRTRGRSRSNSAVELDSEDVSPQGKSHLHSLLQQLLLDMDVPCPDLWEASLIPILLRLALNIRPKVKEGASGYINNYVKLKRIAGAKPNNCELLAGAIFTQKLAHKQMPRQIDHPRILLISFPLEYHRADASQLMSLEPVMAQEEEYLRNLVARMMSLRPTLVFAEKSISGLALQFLLEHHVAVAYNVKSSVIAVLSALTGADIISSVDRLAFQPRVGKCELFEVKTFVHFDGPRPFKKTYMVLKGCPPELGCSVILRGGSMLLLAKIKRIMELMTFVVYNLKLETSLTRDQFATQLIRDNTAALKSSSEQKLKNFSNETLLQLPFEDVFQIFNHRILSSSPGITYPAPYLVRKAVDIEVKLAKYLTAESTDPAQNGSAPVQSPLELSEKQQQDIADLTMEQQNNVKDILGGAEQRRLKQELEHCKAQWKTLLERETREHRDIAEPNARQDITVLFSIVCTATGSPCSLPTTEIIEFYKDSANDYPLGQYVEECVYSALKSCPGVLCQKKNMEHHRSYVHARARVSVITESFACPLPGMQNSILMWSYCKICKSTTPLMPMSDNTWAYSFGKYLELTFYSQELGMRGDTCAHNIYRDHVRYFGFRDMAIRFDYDPVEIMGLALPQPFVDWQPDSFIRLKNEEFKSIQFKITAFFDSLEFRLYNMSSDNLVIEQIEAYKADLSQMRQKAKDERIYLLKLLQEIFDNSKPLDFLYLNRALRATQEKVTAWSETFDQMEQMYLPSEKDIRRLTAAHLRKLFSLDEQPRSEDDTATVDSEGKRSVSAPVGPDAEYKLSEDAASTGTGAEGSLDGSEAKASTNERVVSMPCLTDDEEPRGFHPRRTYEQIIKPKTDDNAQEEEATKPGVHDVSDGIPEKASEIKTADPEEHLSKVTRPQVPRVRPNTNEPPKPSSIPVLKANDASHLRKKSLTTNHVLSKQIQDIGESLVGSVEKKWNEQKRFSSQSKDLPQRNKAGETKVTSLAKHFEQLTREFERERVKARKLLHSRGRPTFAVTSQKPKVAVFDNVTDAVDELSDEEDPTLEPLLDYGGDDYHFSTTLTNDSTPHQTPLQPPASPVSMPTRSIPEIGLDGKSKALDEASSEDVKVERKLDLESSTSGLVPAAERSTLMKTLSNFWADRSSSNWTPLEYPLPPSEHMFAESDVVVREDEPSSLIAFTLSAEEYITEIAALREAARRKPLEVDGDLSLNLSLDERLIKKTLQNPTGTHMRFAWGGDKSNAKLTTRIFFAEQFDALRRFCGCDDNFISSLSRCIKWDSSGGKSGAAFLKTLDDRLIVKQMSKIETEQFLRFAPNYFEYMADNFFNKLPVSLCKILGFYQITAKNPVTGRFMKMDVMVMENLFYKRKTSRIFDLKGSMRNRKVQQTGRENEVLLDENFVELVSENPLFVRDHARRFLKSALHNDTLFLAQNNVMDYSLIIGIDDEKHELIVGIIDFIRTYTWDKKLESWVKERGLVGGGSAILPTVVTPKSYKNRFREAMDRYVFGVGAST